jgi:hypothetical protein
MDSRTSGMGPGGPASGVIYSVGMDPEKDRLVKEMYTWRDELQKDQWREYPSLRDGAAALMINMVTIEDIDWFMFDVFGQFVSDSSISPDVDLVVVKSKLISTLIKIRKKKE